MKIEILGANGPYPSPGAACSGYLVTHNDTSMLLECGPGVLSRLMARVPIGRLDCVVLSHLHYDHMSDMLPMIYLLAAEGRAPLKVIAPNEPVPVRALFEGAKMEWAEPSDMTIGGIGLRFARFRHPVPSYGVRMEAGGRALVYTGDTNTHPELAGFCEGADLLLADSGLSCGDWSEGSPHLSAGLCGKLAREAGVGRLLITHLSPRYDPADLLREAESEFGDVFLARPGDVHGV